MLLGNNKYYINVVFVLSGWFAFGRRLERAANVFPACFELTVFSGIVFCNFSICSFSIFCICIFSSKLRQARAACAAALPPSACAAARAWRNFALFPRILISQDQPTKTGRLGVCRRSSVFFFRKKASCLGIFRGEPSKGFRRFRTASAQ